MYTSQKVFIEYPCTACKPIQFKCAYAEDFVPTLFSSHICHHFVCNAIKLDFPQKRDNVKKLPNYLAELAENCRIMDFENYAQAIS